MTITAPSKPNELTAATIVDNIVAMQPWLREHQAEAERQRRIPQETIERVDAAGVFRLSMPAAYGGASFSMREQFDIYHALASGCGATAWVAWATCAGATFDLAFDDDVMHEVNDGPWVGNRTCACGGTSRRMSGTGRKVDGGWMLQGAWAFATGINHASHAVLMFFYDDTDDSKVGMAMVPKSSLVVRDDWDTVGLAATGSNTVAIEGELFVDDKHVGMPHLAALRAAERIAQRADPRPGGVAGAVVLSGALAIGMAEQALEEFIKAVARRSIPYSPYSRQLDSPITQRTYAQAKIRVAAARSLADDEIAVLDQFVQRGDTPAAADVMRWRATGAYIWDVCAEVVESLFRASGASAVLRRLPLQLIARNCRAGSMHAGMNIDTWMENYGRVLCSPEMVVPANPEMTSTA